MALSLLRTALQRRSALTLLAGALALTFGTLATAQTFPAKPIRLVVTFPSGGAPDILARLFSEKAQ
ncbi:MAG: tripartite tricarboxylate transporter substrate binding protein, partial [Limnohabitans sp.]